jgi:hypothetical protein
VLPTTIESGFEDGIRIAFPEINGEGYPVAHLELKPYVFGDMVEVQERFGICRRCDGQNVVDAAKVGSDGKPLKDAEGKPVMEKQTCTICGGKGNGKTALDLDVRLAIGRKIVKKGDTILGRDPVNGQVRELVWSDRIRDGLCSTLTTFTRIIQKAQELGIEQDAAKKDFTTQPPAGSESVTPGHGAEGSVSGS